MLNKEVNTQGWMYKTVAWFCGVFDCDAPETSCGYLVKGVVTGYFLFILPIVTGLTFLGLPFYTLWWFAGVTAVVGVMVTIIALAVAGALSVIVLLIILGIVLTCGVKPFYDTSAPLVPLPWVRPIIGTYRKLCEMKQRGCKPLNIKKTD